MNAMDKKNKIEVIALFGESASGKDTIQKWLVSYLPNVTHGIISCTTRPPRQGERDGVDYHFITEEEFTKKVLSYDMLEATEFRKWFYGTPIQSLDKDKINVGVFNIAGIEALLEDSRLHVTPIYVRASDKERLIRSLNREENPDCEEICRRYFADKKDFSNIDFNYIEFENNNISLILEREDFFCNLITNIKTKEINL